MPEKIPPHSKEAEQSCLGACLVSREALSEVLEILKPEDFYDSAHKEIFSVMKELYKEDKNVDIITVSEALKTKGSLEAAGGRAYIVDLPNTAPLAINASNYAEIVVEKAKRRDLIAVADEIKGTGYDEGNSTENVLDRAEQKIFEISQKRQRNDYTYLKEVLEENVDLIDKALKADGSLTGLPTGFKKLDEMTNGLQKSDLIILAARPAMGKSAFALNIARNAAKKADASVLIFNLEMSKTQLGMRLLSMESSVKIQNIQAGKVTGDEWQNISLAIDNLAATKIAIDDTPGITILDMKNKCRRMKREQGLDLVIVDYLQLMESDGRVENRQQEVSKISRAFKLLARDLDCPVILLSQLSREPEKRTDHRPIPADLRDSGSIEQDADIIMFLYRDEVYYKEESPEKGICEVSIAKHRNGPTGMTKLTFVGDYTRFADIANENEMF